MLARLWYRCPLRWRLFLAFAFALGVMLLVALTLQSRHFVTSRVEHLLEQELPQSLEHLGAQMALDLAPSIQLSRSLAQNPFLHRWILAGLPEAGRADAEVALRQVRDEVNASGAFLAASVAGEVHYFYFQGDQIHQRIFDPEAASDGWYYRYLARQVPYELNLDTNAYAEGRLRMFVNYSSRAKDARVNQPLLVAGVSLDARALGEMISHYRLAGLGRASLVHPNGQIEISHETSRLPWVAEQPLWSDLLHPEAIQVREITRSEVDHGQPFFVASYWLEEIQRFVVVEVERDALIAPIQQQWRDALLLTLGLLLISLLVLLPLSNSLIGPLMAFQRQLISMTQSLDLKQPIQVQDRAEIGQLAEQSNQLFTRLDQVITQVMQSAGELSQSAHRLAHTAGLVHHQQDIQQAMSQTMAAAIEEMSSSVAEITSTMEELSTSSTQIADHSQSVVDVANVTLQSSQEGAQAMQDLEQRMALIDEENQQSLAEIMALGAKSKEISRVMDLINTLADQTKLIAFNAALEASSAGESGKRFSVVAGEIRRLADSVTDSTREIEQRTQEIQDSIQRLVMTSEKGALSIQQGRRVSSKTAADLEGLVAAAAQTSHAAQQISLSTRQQKTASSQVVVALRDIAAASTHNAQSVRQITEISEEMLQMAATLSDLVSAFHAQQSRAQSEKSLA